LDALQDRQAEEYNGAYGDPVRSHMQYHGSINQSAD
jgi:hypothetical protein